jgi:nucleoside-diphosphate-sugar epimerase
VEVVVAGGHGQVAMLLHPLLRDRGDSVRGLIRNPDHADDVREAGAEPVLCDLEDDEADVAAAVGSADAIVFAAGAGPGSGTSRKRTMDLGGAVKLIDAAKENGTDRYVIVSSMGADSPPPEGDGDVFGEYLRAKAAADEALAASGLDYTIVRPGGLTDEPARGLVSAGQGVGRGKIPRADVAATLAAVLHADATIGKTFNLISGDTPIDEALASL